MKAYSLAKAHLFSDKYAWTTSVKLIYLFSSAYAKQAGVETGRYPWGISFFLLLAFVVGSKLKKLCVIIL